MNKIYKIVWSKVKQCYVVASELARRTRKSPSFCNGFSGSVKIAKLTLAVTVLLNVGLVVPQLDNVSYANTTIIWYNGYRNFDYNGSGNQNGKDYIRVGNTNDMSTAVDYLEGTTEYNKYKALVDTAYNNGVYVNQSVSTDPDDADYTKTTYRGLTTSLGFATASFTTEAYNSYADFSKRLVFQGNDEINLENIGSVTSSIKSGGTTYTAGNGITISSDNKVYV